jgi:hypothetical protein
VTLGDGISWEIDEIARVPQPFVLTVVGPLPETDEVDGQFSSGANTQSPGEDLSYIGNAPVEMCRGITRCNTVGTHQLVLSLRVRFRVASDADSSPPWQTYPLTAPFTAVAHQLPGDFSLVNDPSLGGAISASILPPRFTLTGDYLEGTIVVGKMPVNVAFNVFARFGADEYEIGTIVRPKNEGGTREFHFDVILNHTDATTRQSIFDLILVSNEKLGRQTVNMHDIWNGKLVIPNIYFSASSLYSTH